MSQIGYLKLLITRKYFIWSPGLWDKESRLYFMTKSPWKNVTRYEDRTCDHLHARRTRIRPRPACWLWHDTPLRQYYKRALSSMSQLCLIVKLLKATSEHFKSDFCFCYFLLYLGYCKIPKNWYTGKICCNHPKIWTRWLYRIVMANSVDTAPRGAVWSGATLFAKAHLSVNANCYLITAIILFLR